MTCPKACTPLSVLAALINLIFLMSSAFDDDTDPAAIRAVNKSFSIVFAPGFLFVYNNVLLTRPEIK